MAQGGPRQGHGSPAARKWKGKLKETCTFRRRRIKLEHKANRSLVAWRQSVAQDVHSSRFLGITRSQDRKRKSVAWILRLCEEERAMWSMKRDGSRPFWRRSQSREALTMAGSAFAFCGVPIKRNRDQSRVGPSDVKRGS